LKRVIVFSLILVLFACSSDFGNKIVGGKLTVYYQENSDAEKAEEIANFWKETQLITGEKQDLQLIRDGKGYMLKLISSDDGSVKNMSFSERKLLIDLQKNIRETIFPDYSFELVICNNKFESIYNLN